MLVSVKLIKENNKDCFIYSWNRADNLNSLKRFVFKNQIIKKKKEIDDFKDFKIMKGRFKPFVFSLWNIYSLKIVNLIYLQITKFSKLKKLKTFLMLFFLSTTKKTILIFLVTKVL